MNPHGERIDLLRVVDQNRIRLIGPHELVVRTGLEGDRENHIVCVKRFPIMPSCVVSQVVLPDGTIRREVRDDVPAGRKVRFRPQVIVHGHEIVVDEPIEYVGVVIHTYERVEAVDRLYHPPLQSRLVSRSSVYHDLRRNGRGQKPNDYRRGRQNPGDKSVEKR